MMFDIRKYLRKIYEYPCCWGLVTDVYINEFKFTFKDLDIEGKTVKQLQSCFIASIKKDKLFSIIPEPTDGCIVLMYKNNVDAPDHCGVWIEGRVLHSLENIVLWQPFFHIKDFYTKIEFGVLNADKNIS